MYSIIVPFIDCKVIIGGNILKKDKNSSISKMYVIEYIRVLLWFPIDD